MSKRRFGIVLILLVFIFPLFLFGQENKPTSVLPDSLPGYKLHRTLVGPEAEEVVNKLHQKEVARAESEIGVYRGEKDALMIYVSYYPEAKQAESEYKRMTEKITATPESGFIMGEYLNYNGQQVYRCFGQGKTHFVFTHGKALLWVTVNTMQGNTVMKAYLDWLKQ